MWRVVDCRGRRNPATSARSADVCRATTAAWSYRARREAMGLLLFGEEEEADVVFAEFEGLAEGAIGGNVDDGSIFRAAAAEGIDISDLLGGELTGRGKVEVGRVGIVGAVADAVKGGGILAGGKAGQSEGELRFRM